ncbi:MAG: type I restriction endonuclease [Chloroflexota bacterium]
MDLIDKINELSAQLPRQVDHISTEEATKNALVMPFINALGYNVFDPTEVVPEFVADVGIKKGEKVDYAIMQDEKPIIIMEVKTLGTNLAQVHASQLFRYFTVCDARFGILTNGVEYRFHTDLEKPNKMDEKPFLIFNLDKVDEKLVTELKKFSKSTFDIEHILSSANELKYKREIRNLIDAEYNEPSEDFVKHFARQVYSGSLRQSVVEEFTEITKNAFRDFLNAKIASRLQTALDSEIPELHAPAQQDESDVEEVEETVEVEDDGIQTTQEEWDAYYVVKAILRKDVDASRVTLRDVRSYCGVLLDDNNRKPICRLHFNRSQKYLGLFDDDKNEDRVAIDGVDDIYDYADRLKAIVKVYDAEE